MTRTKMKLLSVNYLGFTAMDRRFSGPMLPWIVSEIRKRDSYEQVSLGVEDGCVQAYNADFELQWAHKVHQVTRFSQVEPDPCCFLYLYRDDAEQLLYCYLFQANRQSDVADLYQQMRDQSSVSPSGVPSTPQRSLSSAAQLVSLCVDISPSSSHFFEVLYVGKIRISHRKVPETFIDDALERFRAHDRPRGAARSRTASTASEGEERRGSVDSVTSAEAALSLEVPASGSGSGGGGQEDKEERVEDHNRTMVLQVGRSDLRLISPDRKLVLLHKQHRDVASCVQGLRDPEHFGFICREQPASAGVSAGAQAGPPSYVGYVFKCESSSVAGDAVNAISQAFSSQERQGGQGQGNQLGVPQQQHLASCEHCPMVWYHRLCAEVENLSDRKTQAAIFRRLDQLDEDEQSSIVCKFKGAETDSIREQNEFLMMLLRAHCESKQSRHMHDTAENRSEFLNQYLGGSTIFMKAKRSLSNSFDHLLKRKGSKDDVGIGARGEMTLPVTPTDTEPERARTQSTRGGSPEHTPGPKSPMMDIFMKVGSSPRRNSESEEVCLTPKSKNTSWRQAIFNRVVTPAKKEPGKIRNREELRELWKRAIKQAILLVRMEKENARLRARQEESAVKRIKLEYDEMMGFGGPEISELWDSLLQMDRYEDQVIQQAVRRGVPRTRRGEVWQLLAERQSSRHPPPLAANTHPNYLTPYSELLRQLTSHQHAILIDLGRTFPQHAYFASALGPGQLALFNLLKAYSLLDNEVGYCQGLSFVAGVLLLHMEEAEAHKLLRHLMFCRGLRNQYLPDMVALQVQLYQLSRLLHDRLPELYNHLDQHEVAPTLYAAPWLLTLFASQFPLGFVTRVFDLLFLEGSDVLFKVALSLLEHHSEKLLACDSFEEIMDYLKVQLPAIDAKTLDAVMRKACHVDLSRQLAEYRVEYQVLQEEMTSVRPQIDALHRLEVENASLHEQNRQLVSQLELALGNVQRLERNRTLQQAAMNRLECQARGLEVSVATLGAFIDTLVEDKIDVEIPGEVRRIVSQLMVAERRRNAAQQQNLLARTISNGTQMFRKVNDRPDRQMVKSLSTGRIGQGLSLPNESVPRSNSLNSQAEMRQDLPALRVIADEEKPQKPSSLGSKMSHFFSTSHSHILQNKIGDHGVKQVIREDSREGLLSPTESNPPLYPLPETPKEETPSIDKSSPTNKPLVEKSSPTESTDSGVVSPLSPKHPLSNCDVNFTFNGTTKLRNIRNIRNLSRNSSPDLLGK